MIYAVTHCKSIFSQSRLHCSSMLKFIDNILANQLYNDLVNYQYDPCSIQAIKEEGKEKMETSSRMLQIKRVVGLLHLMQQGVTKEKLLSCLEALNKKPAATRTLSQLTSLMHSTSKTECIINKSGLQYIIGLCPSAVSDKVSDLEFRFLVTLVSKTKADMKVSQLVLIFANSMLDKEGKLTEEGKLLQFFSKSKVEEVLY